MNDDKGTAIQPYAHPLYFAGEEVWVEFLGHEIKLKISSVIHSAQDEFGGIKVNEEWTYFMNISDPHVSFGSLMYKESELSRTQRTFIDTVFESHAVPEATDAAILGTSMSNEI